MARNKMLRDNTPVENHLDAYGLWVKREDLACLPPGPKFSKTRGVYAHIKERREKLIGVLDTRHSQAGHAVAFACKILGKKTINYYPEFVADKKLSQPIRDPQLRSRELGAVLHSLPAGRSAILFHQARKLCESMGGYMMPNALKLPESIEETAKEVVRTYVETDKKRLPRNVLVAISSGTIAAGVIKGFSMLDYRPLFLIHLGYSRSHEEVVRYIQEASGVKNPRLELIDERYAYSDQAKTPGKTPPWPCNVYYDLKAFRWWLSNGREEYGKALFWNVG